MSCYTQSITSIGLLGPLFLWLLCSACTPTREDHRDSIAEADCTRREACNQLEEDYTSFENCMVDKRSDYNKLWPEDECGQGRINEDKVDQCVARVRGASCGANIFDVFAFSSECHAGKVCIDPAQ